MISLLSAFPSSTIDALTIMTKWERRWRRRGGGGRGYEKENNLCCQIQATLYPNFCSRTPTDRCGGMDITNR